MKCIRCGEQIPFEKNSKKYCGNRCAKLYLKAQYKKRNRDKVNEYNRNYRKGVRSGLPSGTNTRKFERDGKAEKLFDGNVCYFCDKDTDLEWHHISYDAPILVVKLCRGCHRKLHKLLRVS